jgi:hypothetical protein
MEWDFCHICGGDNSSCLVEDCDCNTVPKLWLGDAQCDDGRPRQLFVQPNAGWETDPESWWVQCTTLPYFGLADLLPFCYDTMEYIPFYDCRTPNGTLLRVPNDFDPWFNATDNSTGPTCADAGGKMTRSQTGTLVTSAPRDTTWAADGASWWEVCSITPSVPGCVDENVDAWKRRTVNQFNSTVIDYRDLANIGAPGDAGRDRKSVV